MVVIQLFNEQQQAMNASNHITAFAQKELTKEILDLIEKRHSCLMPEDLDKVFYSVKEELWFIRKQEEMDLTENLKTEVSNEGNNTEKN
ncbi:MAG: hypothetical protein JRF50_16025 [Deltaproteobacteria bacterium]|nr:hypothetical protein [Deltaproteobacteria bacterium]